MGTYGLFLLESLAAIAVVLAAAYLLFRYANQWPLGLPKGKGRHVELLERLPLGPKQSLAVVRFGNKVLLLGLSDGGIHLLQETGEPGSSPPAALATPGEEGE